MHGMRLGSLGTQVNERVRMLSRGYLGNRSYETASLARLRRSVGHDVGADPDIFAWTLPDDEPNRVEAGHPSDDKPTIEEQAMHVAMTLFAVHQQSIHDASMHTDEFVSLGRAVGRMAYGNFNEAGIRRSFSRLQTASSWKELVRHARELVKLLKREQIPLNYGLLAQDLVRFHAGRRQANGVRLRWGRDYRSAYSASQKSEQADQ